MKQVSYSNEWMDRLEAHARKGLPEGVTPPDRNYREAAYVVFPAYLLFCYCEKFREQRATTWQRFEGLTPARLRLIEKHHWLPDQVEALKEDQLLLLLHEELADLRLPAQAHQKLVRDFHHLGIRDISLNSID